MKGYAVLCLLVCSLAEIYSATLYDFGGHQKLQEDETSVLLTLESPFILDGIPYLCFHVNAEGVVSFFGPVEYSPSIGTLERLQLVTPAIVPFWTTIDITYGGSIYYRNLPSDDPIFVQIEKDIQQVNSSFIADLIVIVTWENVSLQNPTLGDDNTFQTILATDGESSYVIFRYHSLDWSATALDKNVSSVPPAVGIVGEDSLFHLVFSQSENISELLYHSNYDNHSGVYLYAVHGYLDEVADSTMQVCVDGEVRLQGSTNINEGRIEVCSQNVWYGVCNNLWDNTDASVVCRQLGFGIEGSLAFTDEIFGQFAGQFLLDNAECSGHEGGLLTCISDNIYNCSNQGYASVVCSETFETQEGVCSEGSVRLVGGCSATEGRVEVCSNNIWGTVCYDGFDERAASIVCRQLGFSGAGATSHCCSLYGEGRDPVFVDSTYCNESEYSLLNCSIMFNNSSTCTQNATSVTCLQNCPELETTSKFGTYMWPETIADETEMLPCEYDIYENALSYTTRTCGRDGNWEDVDYSNCSTEYEYLLDLISDDNVTDNSVQQILEALHNATSLLNSTEDLTAGSVSIITDTVKKVADCSCTADVQVVEDLVSVLNNVIEWTAEGLDMTIDITENFERALSFPPSASQNGTLTINSSRITFTRLQSNSSNYISTGLSYQTVKSETGITGGSLMAGDSPNTEASLASVQLPDELFRRLNSNVDFEALFVVYENPNLFPVQNGNNSRRVASSIISITIFNQSESAYTNLSSDVLISLTLTSSSYRSPECVFWDMGSQAWSSEGCKNVTEEDFVGATILCRCNHLTTFGVMVNANPMECPDGYANNFDATACIGIKPELELSRPLPEMAVPRRIEINPWEELEIMCTSSGEFPGNVTWRKLNEQTGVYIDIPEIDLVEGRILGMSISTLGSDERAVLKTEVSGQLYAYKINETHAILGTRRADVFGAAIGIDFIADGVYECFASNQYSNSSVSVNISVPEIHETTTYIRFTVSLLEDSFDEFLYSNNTNQTTELLLGIISTALLKSFEENITVTNGSILVNCMPVSSNSLDNQTRISCQFLNASGTIRVYDFKQQLPSHIRLLEDPVIAPGFCDAEDMFQSSDNRGTFVWNETEVGQVAKSSCIYGALNAGGYATRMCLQHQMWGPYDGSACCTKSNSDLCNLPNITTEKEAEQAVDKIASTLTDIPVEDQTQESFGAITRTYEEIDTLIRNRKIVATNSMTTTTVRVLSLVSDWPAESISQTSSNLVSSFEGIATNLASQESFKDIHFMESNVDFLAAKVGSNSQPVDRDNIYDSFNRPAEVYSRTSNDKQNEERKFVIRVPEDLVDKSDSYIYSIYETPALFQVVPSNGTNDNVTNVTTEVDSMVVGFTLVKAQEAKSVSNLRHPVIITFRSLNLLNRSNIGSVECVSWDFEAIQLGNDSYRGNWTNVGCTLNDRETSVEDGVYVCHCSHLTNFAVLVSTGDPAPLSTEASVLTYIGCFMSIICLTATLVSLLIFKSIRRKVITKFHFQLCLSLLLLYLVFLIGIDRIEVDGVCSTMSFFIHYFALASFFWTGAEALVMLKTFVYDVFGNTTWKFIAPVSIICWTAPLLFAILNVIISQSTPTNYMVTYIDDKLRYCFISDFKVHVPLFLIPMYIIIIFNVVAFVFVVKVLVNQAVQKKKRTIKSDKSDDVEAVLRVMMGIFSVMIVFGLFWLIGVLNVSKAAVYFQWPFLILNTSLGIIIFVLIGVLNPRKEWKELFLSRKKGLKGSSVPLRSKDAVTTSKSSETRFSALPTDSRGRAVSQDYSSNKELESEMKIPDDIKV